ncbi:nitroreductase/quinone reductase family protein [Diaminobutyricibacter sp. McL0618]|uniref:nitroreductase/quinone reductase family protein n=1 Tax=Leifsonia sp. McL0618 TaxID=3415677 RepID=UPI003CED509D
MSESRHTNWNEPIIAEFRANDGTVASRGFGRSLVLLHHTGAKSGVERVTPVMKIADGDGWLVAASKAGADDHPAWYHNLLAHPDIMVELPGEGEVAVHVEELKGAERDAGWEKFKAASPGFQSYEARTTRLIPVLKLHRR